MMRNKNIWGITLGDNASSLERLVNAVYREIAQQPANLPALKGAMVDLLSYLSSPEGRTDSNCVTVDTFFCIRNHWETEWDHLPIDFQHILDDIGGALHDTVSSPDIAENFESTPEQLLARVHKIDFNY